MDTNVEKCCETCMHYNWLASECENPESEWSTWESAMGVGKTSAYWDECTNWKGEGET